MQGRAFLILAREQLAVADEVHRRGAVGRAYYALFLESREALSRWGLPPPRGISPHSYVRLRFVFPANPDLKKLGRALEELSHRRNDADYELAPLAVFASDAEALRLVQRATDAIALLDAVDADPARRAAAVAAIRTAFP